MKKLLLIFLPLFFIISCEETPNTAQKELLVGAWIFESGTKNGQAEGTELLNNLIFSFTEETFECDLLPEMMTGLSTKETYELNENIILVDKKLELEIKELTTDQLLVKFQIEIDATSIDFDLKFVPHQVS